jgi:CYTH domain-containing protein
MIEREKKFLIAPTAKWAVLKYCQFKTQIVQSYIVNTPDEEIRVRVKGDAAGLNNAEMTYKQGQGESREENTVPLELFMGLKIVRFLPAIIKKRYVFGRWEIDIFDSFPELITAEYELEPDEILPLYPSWMGCHVVRDVTFEEYFKNKNLVVKCAPFLW